MPLYSYSCKCGTDFDSFKCYAERKTAECPKCGKNAQKVLSNVGTAVDFMYKDSLGTPIWFPKDGKPYYDRFLGKEFTSKAEKCAYMREKGIVMDGSDNPKEWPIEAGDMRSREFRRKNKMED